MKTNKAFTLIELLVVVAVLAMLSCLLLPVLAHSRGRSAAAGCLSNMRQLMAGWSMYREENSDILMLNAPLGANGGWVANNFSEDWFHATGNTNVASLQNGTLWPYLQNDARPFKCPADVVPSDNGQRLRSYSMNGQIGSSLGSSYNPGWRMYSRGGDMTCPGPASLFVFCDEHPGSINDGFLQPGLNSPIFPDVPAAYLDGACGFSFADGHGEIHAWQSSTLLLGVVAHVNQFQLSAGGGVGNADWQWLKQHSACKP
jgi:prepilin-type N-terminal cleavage/methylation domain-containing protein